MSLASGQCWLHVALVVAVMGSSGLAFGAPSPRPGPRPYDVSILGFNDGTPYRLKGAEVEAVLGDPSSVVFRFQGRDWLGEEQRGAYVSVQEISARFSHRNASEVLAVYRLDTDADGTPELLVVPDEEALGGRHRYAPTLLSRTRKGSYRATWAADSLRGEKHRVVDIRDLNQDGRPEVLLAGEGGRSGYYQFRQLVGRARTSFRSLSVPHVDSVHYVDLEGDGHIEVVVRERVGRRGPASQWTYVDRLYQWNGAEFTSVDDRFPHYHDQETLPRLVGELINLHDAKVPILEEKMAAIRQVRSRVMDLRPRPSTLDRRLVAALASLQKDQLDKARDALDVLQAEYPYDLQVLLALTRVYGTLGEWQAVLDYGLLALTVEPRERWAWWWTGVALIELEERSSAVASFHNLIRLSGHADEGAEFLRARRGEPGTSETLRRVIEQTLAQDKAGGTP